MALIKITCPSCKYSFTLRVADPATLVGKTFNCPKCRAVVPFARLMGGAPGVPGGPALRTHIAGAGGVAQPGGSTRLHNGGCRVMLTVVPTGRKFEIGAGTYVLGRDSGDSQATLKLAPDAYMSRQHARLSVSPDASGVRCVLVPMHSRNDVYVNKRKVEAGTPVQINNGDEILLGMTVVKVTK